ncbi:MAG: alpha/beta hydrolase [Trueperaceae bacterium]|nr:alpha/beta hydrolase [Trueperaceae bacterium]
MIKTWQEGDVDSSGVKIHYYRTGGEGPKLILLHGITDNGLCWPEVTEALGEKYDIIMLDARGHGLSDHAASYLPKDHVADVDAVMENLGIAKAAVLGHSMGAVNASYFAVTHPEKLSCLLLEDPPWHLEPQSIVRDNDQWRKDIILRRTRTLEDIMAEGERDNPKWKDYVFPTWAEAKRQVDPNVLDWADKGQTFANWQQIVRDLSCPTLLLTGGKEAIVDEATAKKAAALNSLVSVANMSEAGHSIRREQLDDYLKAVTPFLEKHAR